MKSILRFQDIPTRQSGIDAQCNGSSEMAARKFLFVLLLLASILFGFNAKAQISYSSPGSNYTQNFDNLYTTVPGNNSVVAVSPLPAGWQFIETGANANTTLRNDNGNSTTGDTFFYGASTSNERAFGSYASGSLTSQYGAVFTNSTGAPLTQFTLSYTGEQWKDGGSAQAVLNSLAFAYAINTASVATGTYVNVSGLNFTALVNNTSADVATDGNAANRRMAITLTVTGISWPAGQNLCIRWSDANDTGNDDGLAVDDVTFSASAGAAAPTITTAGTLSAVNTIYGTASPSPTSYTVSGSNLGATDIAITAPAGFEISKTGIAGTYATSHTLTPASGSVALTTIYVRLAATTVAGTYSGNITHVSGTGSSNVATASSTVAQKSLTVSGAVGQNKIYDRTATATITGATAVGTVNGDAITLTGGGLFADFLAETGKAILASLTITGANATSYTLVQPTGLTADITPKNLTVASAAATNKTYDGNTDVVITGTLSGVIAPDEVNLNLLGNFTSPFAGTGITVASTSSIDGADAANYNLVQPVLSANIAPKALTIAGAAAANKVFDGNTDAVINGTISGVVSGDDVDFIGTGVFAQSAVGLNIPVTSTATLTGADVANYILTQPTGLTANISADELTPQTITFAPLADVTYGDAAFNLTATASSGLDVTYVSSDTNVATVLGDTITIVGVGTTTITASQSGDLTYDSAPTVDQTLTVNAKSLTIAGASAGNKVYDGNNTASISGTLSGIVGSDNVALVASGTFATTGVANSIAVTSTSTLSGSDSANYVLVQPTGLAANITAKSLTVANAVADNKPYDGNTTATISGSTLNGVVGLDDVSVTGNGTFANANVANGIAVTASLTLQGADATNYTLTQPTGLLANITPLALAITGLSGNNKVYDATTAASISGTALLNGIIGSDDVNVSGTPTAVFADKTVGVAKTITVNGYVLSGAQAGNYTLATVSGITADITAATLTITGATAQNKVFDGTTAAAFTGTLSTILGADAVSFVGTGTFASSAVGNNIAVTSTATLTGADATNYTLIQPTGLVANITPAPTTLANWTYEPLQGATATPSPNTGSGSSSLVGMTGPGTGTGMNTATGCGAQTSGTTAWAIATANPGATNETNGARFNTSTVGHQNIKFTWEQRWSNTSANTVRVQYTTNGTTWTNFNMTALNTAFCLGSLNAGRFETAAQGDVFRRISVDLTGISGVDNNVNFGVRVVAAHYQATGQFRQAATPASVATGGTWRFDNVKFVADQIPAPSASAISGSATICVGATTNITVSITGGTSPFAVVYTDGTDNFTVSGYTSGGNIPVSPTTTSTYSLVSVTDANNLVGTGNSGSATVTVNQLYPFYVDADGDSYGTGNLVSVCAMNATTPPANYSLNNTDCNDGVAAINPGQSEALYNGVDDNCDGNNDEGFQYTTTINPTQCATTLSTINSFIVALTKPSVTAYRFEVTNTTTNAIQTLVRTQNYFSPTMLAAYDYATTYSIRVEIQRNGVWLSYYGAACLVSTPAVLAPGGAATVTPGQCGQTIPTISTLIATTSLANVTGYKFRVTNATDTSAPNQVQTIDRGTLNWFSLTMLATFNYGTTYLVEVSIKTNGVFSNFGSPCAVTAPPVPQIAYCGQLIATKGTLISVPAKDRVTSYRFRITNFSTNIVTTIDRTQNWFTFNNVPASNYTPGGLYGVQVAVMTSGGFSTFSEGCEITAPAAARTIEAKPVFEVAAYPNPFADSFSIHANTASEEDFNIRIYDMTGRLLESRRENLLDMQTIQVGNAYPSGVYNVIITQGEHVKTLRVIKR